MNKEMKQYTGTKTVKAMPMTMREANELKSASLTPAILKKMWIEKWDGSVPQVVTGGSNSTFIDISKLK